MRIVTLTSSVVIVASVLSFGGILPAHANAPSTRGAAAAPAAPPTPAVPAAARAVPAPAATDSAPAPAAPAPAPADPAPAPAEPALAPADPAPTPAASTTPSPAIPAARDGNAMVALAQQHVGVVPYSNGASPEDGFACDGLTQWVYGQFGVELPRGVTAQAARGVQVSAAEAQAGDLVVYVGEHIGIYDGAGGIIDSPDWGRFVSHRAIWGEPLFVHIP